MMRPLPSSSMERQSSKESRTTSPLREPPTYTQAMKGSSTAGPYLSATSSSSRQRSYSESITASTSGPSSARQLQLASQRARGVTAATATKSSDSNSGAESSARLTNVSETESPVAGLQRSAAMMVDLSPKDQDKARDQDTQKQQDTPLQVQSLDNSSVSEEPVKSENSAAQDTLVVVASLSDQDTLQQQQREEIQIATEARATITKDHQRDDGGRDTGDITKEFARDIRGTSTPIDISPSASPKPIHVITLNDTNLNKGEEAHKEEVDADVSVEITIEGGQRRPTMQRENAFES